MDHPDPWLIPFQHNHWATRDMLERCRTLTDEQFHQRFDLGPGSLHDTFRHIIGAMMRWTDRIGQRPLRDPPEKAKAMTADELIRLLDVTARELEVVARDVHDNKRFADIITWPSDEDPKYRFHKTTALVHVTTHGMHHRAQVRWMMRQLAMDISPDWDTVEWEVVETGQATF